MRDARRRQERQISVPGPKGTADTEIERPRSKITRSSLFKREPFTSPKLIQDEKLNIRNTTNAKIRPTSRPMKTSKKRNPLNQKAGSIGPKCNIITSKNRSSKSNPFRIPKPRRTRQESIITNSMNQTTPLGERTSRPD